MEKNPSVITIPAKGKEKKSTLLPFALRNLVNIREAAYITGFSQEYLRVLCRGGNVSHVRRGARYFFTHEQVDNFFVSIKLTGKK